MASLKDWITVKKVTLHYNLNYPDNYCTININLSDCEMKYQINLSLLPILKFKQSNVTTMIFLIKRVTQLFKCSLNLPINSSQSLMMKYLLP